MRVRTLLSFFLLGSFHILPAQTTWEFSGTTYASQKQHFDSATAVVKTKLGKQMRTFGAPFNQIDATLLQVMSEDPNYRVLLFGQVSPSAGTGQINLTNRVFIESATGVPDYQYFLSSWYSKKGTYTDYMVMQGHPYAWTTTTKQTEFESIVNYLIATDSVVFTTPYGYYRYLTDLSIPRTSKIQVILKLDDLRAASTYFYPVFTTFNYLITHNVKASFGVNNLSALTQPQIDTLTYFFGRTNVEGDTLFEMWNHGLDHSMSASTLGGNWSDGASWPSGMVPTAADEVEIPSGVTVTVDVANAECSNLTVNGTLVMLNTAACGLTVYGDVVINSTGSFTAPTLTGGTSNLFHTLTVYGDFTNNGGTFDFRAGSAGTTLRAINTSFVGSYNSTITVGTYSTTNNDFNGITINKSSGAKVICGSDVVCDPGSSGGVSQLTLTNGIVETGAFTLYALSTTSGDVVSASSASYINGALGRGMSNSAGKVNAFAVGDAAGYRPISVRSTTGGTQTGHHVIVRAVHGNANTGSSVLTGIDSVSRVRYYRISYHKGLNAAAAASMSFSQFSPSYGTDDGVAAGNTNLRVAYSADERATWTGMDQTTTHTTSLTSPPTTITPTVLTSALTLNSGSGAIYVALSDVNGSTVNPLPVEWEGLSASARGSSVEILWRTAMERENIGFEVERAVIDRQGIHGTWSTVGMMPGQGTTDRPQSYRFTDAGVPEGSYRYRVRQVDRSGNGSYSPDVEVMVGVPAVFALSQNVPNPFNPSTLISFTLQKEARTVLAVYSMLGQKVATLVDAVLPAGVVHHYTFSGAAIPSGVYFCSLQSGANTAVKKMVLLR